MIWQGSIFPERRRAGARILCYEVLRTQTAQSLRDRPLGAWLLATIDQGEDRGRWRRLPRVMGTDTQAWELRNAPPQKEMGGKGVDTEKDGKLLRSFPLCRALCIHDRLHTQAGNQGGAKCGPEVGDAAGKLPARGITKISACPCEGARTGGREQGEPPSPVPPRS